MADQVAQQGRQTAPALELAGEDTEVVAGVWANLTALRPPMPGMGLARAQLVPASRVKPASAHFSPGRPCCQIRFASSIPDPFWKPNRCRSSQGEKP